MSCVKDEQEVLKLDENFKQTLRRIEPYFLNLTSPADKRLCKLWLDKLCASVDQRQLRNFYLYKLHEQLKANKIKGVFKSEPPEGPLAYQGKVYLSSSLSNLSNSTPRRPVRMLYRKLGFTSASGYTTDESTLNSVRTQEKGEGSSTWGEVDSCRSFVQELSEAVNRLKLQNRELRSKFKEHLDSCQADESLCVERDQTLKPLDPLTKSTDGPAQETLPGVNAVNLVEHSALEFTDEVNKCTMAFEEEEFRNSLLNEEINRVVQKLEEKIRSNEVEYKEKMRNMYRKFEILLKEKDEESKKKDETIAGLEERLAKKESLGQEEVVKLKRTIEELELKLKIKCSDEQKLQTMLTEQYANMKREFHNIRTDIKFTASRNHSNLRNKVAALKKTIQRLEKSKEKVYQEYEKRISRILKDQSLVKRSMELEMMAQQSELSCSMNFEKQKEVNQIANSLDERCQAFLSDITRVRIGSKKSGLSVPPMEAAGTKKEEV